jgi:hypothetical protein
VAPSQYSPSVILRRFSARRKTRPVEPPPHATQWRGTMLFAASWAAEHTTRPHYRFVIHARRSCTYTRVLTHATDAACGRWVPEARPIPSFRGSFVDRAVDIAPRLRCAMSAEVLVGRPSHSSPAPRTKRKLPRPWGAPWRTSRPSIVPAKCKLSFVKPTKKLLHAVQRSLAMTGLTTQSVHSSLPFRS